MRAQRALTQHVHALTAGVVRVTLFCRGIDVAPHSCRTPSSSPQHHLGETSEPWPHSTLTFEERGLSHLTGALDVSSSKKNFWLVSAEASSCNRPINSVINPSPSRTDPPVPAPTFKIAKMSEAASANAEEYLLGELPDNCHHFGSCEVPTSVNQQKNYRETVNTSAPHLHTCPIGAPALRSDATWTQPLSTAFRDAATAAKQASRGRAQFSSRRGVYRPTESGPCPANR